MTDKRPIAGDNKHNPPLASGLEAILRHIGNQRYPPVERWEPELCGEIDIHIRRDGRWVHEGSPIGRARLVKLFASVLRRDQEAGPYYLVTPVEKLEIKVDVAPLLAVEMAVEGEGEGQIVTMRSNVDDLVVVDQDHPFRMEEFEGEKLPLLRLRGRIDALVTRAVFYELVNLAVRRDEDGPLGFWSSGVFFELGHADG